LCWAACILLLPPHGLVLETCSRSRSVEKIDDKESLTPNRLLSALGRKSPNPERRQLWLFFSTSEPHHQNPFALWFGPQYLRPSSRRCARWAQPNFQLHSSWIWIDPFGSFCNLPVQRFPPLSEGLGSASLYPINCTLYFFHIVRNRVKVTSLEPSERQKNIDGLPK
jgi:hypothetical protein